jgi:hypothetical protein
LSDSKMSRNRPRSGGEWSSWKQRRKAGNERTARREEWQVRVAQTRVGRKGRQRNISHRRSSPRAHMVVGAASGNFDDGGSSAMA